MAEGHTNQSSASVTNSDSKTNTFHNKIEKSSFLFYDAKIFTWKGDLKSLKAFVATILKCDNGKWSSPRAEEKLFKNEEFSLKWFGPKKKKLQIMKDNQEKSLQAALEESAQTNGVKILNEKVETTTHVDDASQQQQDAKLQHVDENHSVCGNCEEYKHQIANIMTLVAEIKAKQQEESQRAVSDATKFEITIKTLSAQNNKMAAEIELLKSGMSELSSDNANIKCVLDIKQNEWTKVTKKAKKLNNPAVKNTKKINPTSNTFQVLDIEEANPTNGNAHNNTEAKQTRGPSKDNLTRYRKLPEFKDKDTRKGHSSTADTTTNSTTKYNQPKQEKAVLVIGDSMVKHIDGGKIGRAARSKAISHSYSGATVNQLARKFDECQSEELLYNTIILHVGTNDLVREEPEKVAADMDDLVNKVKAHTNKVAVSGAIKRYDGKVNNYKIEQYNKLIHGLCSKHNIAYIDNSCIGRSLLNASNLHLNRDGDKALGSAFCTYLKSDRISTRNSDYHFFRLPSGRQSRQREWTMYLSHVKHMMKHNVE